MAIVTGTCCQTKSKDKVRLNEACVVVTTDYGAEELVRAMSGFNWSIQEAVKQGGIQLISMIPVTSAVKDPSLKSVPLTGYWAILLSLHFVWRCCHRRIISSRRS
jgi:hypothetical protein